MASASGKSSRRALVLLGLLASSAALAYVIPSYSILRRLVQGREDLRLSSLKVVGTAVFPTEAAAEAGAALNAPSDRDVQADATVLLRLPGRCRVDLTTSEGAAISAISAQGKRRNIGKEISAVNTALTHLCPVLALRGAGDGEGRDGLERHLRSINVETKERGLARFDGKIAFVIGRIDPKESQFWVYKDSFQPARLMWSDPDGTRWDVRFRNFGSPVSGDAFPRILEVARNNTLALRLTILEAENNPKLADDLFK